MTDVGAVDSVFDATLPTIEEYPVDQRDAPSGPRRPGWLAMAEAALSRVTEAVVALALAAELVVMFGNVIARSFFNQPWLWADEVGSDLLSIIAFVGAAIAVERGQVIAMEALIDRLPARYREIARAVGDWIIVVSGVVLVVLSRTFLDVGKTGVAPTLSISAFWTELAFPVGVALFVVNVLRCRLRYYPLRTVIASGVLVIAGAVALYAMYESGSVVLDSSAALVVILIAFAVMVLIGMPIMFAFVVAAMLFLLLSNTVGVDTIPPKVWNAPRNPVLLAVPFFTWAGFVLTKGGLSPYLAGFITRLVGHLRGGILQVVVVCMYLFSGISGSKVADMAAVSATLKDAVKDEDDDGRYTAVLNSSAAMGETIPPSIGIIVVGTITSLSITSLFLAGLLPALALAACLMGVIYVQARLRNDSRGSRSPLGQTAKAFLLAVPALTVAVVMIGGVVGGYSTPTEVSAVAVVYALVLAAALYRKLTWTAMWGLTIETVSIAGMALFALSTASAFSFTLTIAQVPQTLGGWISDLHVGPTVFMIVCALFLILMGSVLEGLPSMLIFMPLLLAPAIQVGVNPIQFAIVMLVAIGIGVHAPPLGVGFYVACLLTNKKPAVVIRPMWTYLAVLTAGLLLLIVVPGVSLWLPQVFGKS